HHLPTQGLAQLVGDQPCQRVGAAARRTGHDKSDRFVGIALYLRGNRSRGQSQQGEERERPSQRGHGPSSMPAKAAIAALTDVSSTWRWVTKRILRPRPITSTPRSSNRRATAAASSMKQLTMLVCTSGGSTRSDRNAARPRASRRASS